MALLQMVRKLGAVIVASEQEPTSAREPEMNFGIGHLTLPELLKPAVQASKSLASGGAPGVALARNIRSGVH
jgi:hypothetical protein